MKRSRITGHLVETVVGEAVNLARYMALVDDFNHALVRGGSRLG